MQQQLAVTPTLAEPVLGAALAVDAAAAGTYCADLDAALRSLGPSAQRDGERRAEAAALKASARAVKERFFRRHAAAIYDDLTDHGARTLRVRELLAAARSAIRRCCRRPSGSTAERALKQQSAKEGLELDQGLFLAQILADERIGMHLIHAMLKPKREALDRLRRIPPQRICRPRRAKVERKGKVGHVTLTNTKFLNAEDDRATAALETAVDLVLLDDAIEVGVLRGGTVAASEICRPPHLQRRHQSHASLLRPDLVCRVLHRARAWAAAQDLSRPLARGILRRAIRGLCREAVDRRGRGFRHRRRLSAALHHGPRARRARLLFQPAGQQGRLHPRRRQSAAAAARRHQARARGHFLRARLSCRYAGRPHDLRRGRARRRDGRGDRAERAAARARRHDQRGGQPQGAARRARAAVDLSPLYGDLCAAAEPVPLRPKLIDNLEHSWQPGSRRM